MIFIFGFIAGLITSCIAFFTGILLFQISERNIKINKILKNEITPKQAIKITTKELQGKTGKIFEAPTDLEQLFNEKRDIKLK